MSSTFTFEQAWNIYAAALGSILGGVTAAQAARGEIPEGKNAAKALAGLLRSRGERRRRVVVGQAVYRHGSTQGSAKIFALAKKYSDAKRKRS